MVAMNTTNHEKQALDATEAAGAADEAATAEAAIFGMSQEMPSSGHDRTTGQIWIADARASKLNEIHRPPACLYFRGDADLIRSSRYAEEYTYICIIGSRKHTEYGRYVTREILKVLRGQSVIVVSGLAEGIDTVALETAMEFRIPVIAVLGSGLGDSVIYPQSNIGLAHRIADGGGLVVSEHDDDVRATRWSFPLRNRIMAGLSDAIIVIEGTTKSGTMITARLGLDFGREVIAVPGPITSYLSRGPLSLISDGATPLTHPEHLLDILGLHSRDLILRERLIRENTYERLSPEELAVVRALVDQPLDRDSLRSRVRCQVHELQILLTMLEIKNLIVIRQGKIMLL